MGEVHSRKTLSSCAVSPLGCAVRGDRRPSVALGKPGTASTGGAPSQKNAPPGFGSLSQSLGEGYWGGQQQGGGALDRQTSPHRMLTVSALESGFSGGGGRDHMIGGGIAQA